MELRDAQRVGVGFRRSPDGAEETLLLYDAPRQRVLIDRTRSSLAADVPKEGHSGPLALEDGVLRLRLFLDCSMVEAYLNGRRSITSRVYPSRDGALGLRLLSEGGSAHVRELDVWRMGSAYGAG